MASLYKKIRQKGWGNANTKKIKKELNDLEQERKKPSKEWKKKYECKRNKGNHEYTLIAGWSWQQNKNIDIEEYYHKKAKEVQEEAKKRSKSTTTRLRYWGDSLFIHWKCIHCGKETFDTSDKPSKKIRKNIIKEYRNHWILKFRIKKKYQ